MTRLSNTLFLPILTLALSACADRPGSSSGLPAQTAEIKKPTETSVSKKPASPPKQARISSISLTDLFALQETGQVLIFDARPRFHYGMGHLPGAVNLPKSDCVSQIKKREPEIKAAQATGKTIVIYCAGVTCPDARTVANHLSAGGFPSSIFSGGWEAWKASGLSVESHSTP